MQWGYYYKCLLVDMYVKTTTPLAKQYIMTCCCLALRQPGAEWHRPEWNCLVNVTHDRMYRIKTTTKPLLVWLKPLQDCAVRSYKTDNASSGQTVVVNQLWYRYYPRCIHPNKRVPTDQIYQDFSRPSLILQMQLASTPRSEMHLGLFDVC